jgi:putative transposase
MARRNRTPEEKARRAKIRELLQMTNIGSMDDIQNLFKETIAEFMENGLEAELDDKLGYSKYDYKNKDTDNSRNRYSMADLKAIYAAVDEASALAALDAFAEKWDKKYPKIARSWRDNWPNLSTYFKYPQEVRRLIYTTNTIEGFNRQLRKVTKSKSVFPTDDSLLKTLYLAMMDITKKWTGRRQDWSLIHAQLSVFFADRMPD